MVSNAAQYLDRPSLIVGEAFLDFDATSGGGTDVVTLIPAAANEYGMVLIDFYGIVIEQFGGGTEDQGICALKDTASSPNTLSTLTPSDAGADAVNDIVVGTGIRHPATTAIATGGALKVVAAGNGATVTITQQTSGSSVAGQMRVFAVFQPFMQATPTS